MVEYRQPKSRPVVLRGVTYNVAVGCGTLYVTVNEDSDGSVYEIFLKLGKSGSCVSSMCEGLCRMVTFSFRLGAHPDDVIKQLRGIRCPTTGKGDHQYFSCVDAVSKVLKSHVESKLKSK
ncbi:MAG TPA: TSCPD domain-containing protein [bacterium]|nr:TSCPD domain-containing protein [bacterium]